MFWTEFHLDAVPDDDRLRAALEALFGVAPAAVLVVDDIAHAVVDADARVVCERMPQPGEFPCRLGLYLHGPAPGAPEPVIAALCARFGCRALADDGSPDPYRYLLVHPDGRREHVTVDPGPLDALEALVLATPTAAPYRALAPSSTLRPGDEGDLYAVLNVTPSVAVAPPWGPPSLLVYLTLGLGPWASLAPELDVLRRSSGGDARHRALFGVDRPRGAVVVADRYRPATVCDLAPAQVEAIARALRAAGIPDAPPVFTVDGNPTGAGGLHVAFSGVAGAKPFAVTYGGLDPFTLVGPKVRAWADLLAALLDAAGVPWPDLIEPARKGRER